MSKNKKKKLKKKEKIKQKMLELTQQQIQVEIHSDEYSSLKSLLLFIIQQDAEKQKQNLLSPTNQINLNKLTLNEPTSPLKPGKMMNLSFVFSPC